jgi:hypothetical protein
MNLSEGFYKLSKKASVFRVVLYDVTDDLLILKFKQIFYSDDFFTFDERK